MASIAELIGLQRATERYLRRPPTTRMAPFTMEWALRLHWEIFGKAWRSGAGTIRTARPNFGVATHQVRPLLTQLTENARVWTHDPIKASADLHSEAVRIHPFADGNGRWARLLANIWLRQKTGEVILWPPDISAPGSTFRAHYLNAIEAAVDQKKMDHEPLYVLHRQLATWL